MKLDRLLAITMLLINRKKMTAKDLAEYFEVSVRTVLRDIEAINQAGIPIVSYQGANGGFGIMENFKIDRNVLTTDDILSIVTALKGVSSTLDDRKISDTLEKVKALMPANVTPEKNSLMGHIVIDFSPWGASRFQREKLNLIKKAIEQSKTITFYYTNAGGQSAEREAEPVSLAFKGYSWYLHGYCRSRNDFRIFRLSRMKEVKVTDNAYILRDKPLEELPREMDAGSSSPPVELVLRFSPRVRARVEDFFDAEYISPCEDGSTLVNVTYPEDEWVYGTLLSFGDDLEILAPGRIRQIIADRARRIWEKYSG